MLLNISVNGIKKILFGSCLLLFIATLIFCSWYIASGYDKLVKWYFGLDPCFYRSKYWTSDFFIKETKVQGDRLSLVAIIIAVSGILLLLRKTNKEKRQPRQIWPVKFERSNLIYTGICLIVTTGLWFWANSLAVPSNDEVFSAQNCAGIHPFQTVSYYMLPNNHVLFNLLNNIVFHGLENKSQSGRILSLIFYWALALSLLSLFNTLLKNKWLALLAALTIAVQFPIWGFGCQGRGYELLALAEWVTFIAFLKYTVYHERQWLYIMSLAVCAGYFTIPIFMYFHAAVLFFAFCRQIANKSFDGNFWTAQAIAGVIVFLLYLPCLCFSGLQAIVGNPWFNIQQSYRELWADLVPTCHEFMDYCFCNIGQGNYFPDLFLFLLPFSLLFYRHNVTARLFGWFYCCMWGILILFVIKMKVYPMDRALPGQFSITLAFVIYAIYLAIDTAQMKLQIRYLPAILLPVTLIIMSLNCIKKDKVHITHYQCHFNVIEWDKLLTAAIKSAIPPGSSVACSDESFYWYYLCRKYGYDVTKCPRGNELYLVKLRNSEQFPFGRAEDFLLLEPVGDYGIYRRK